MRPDRDGRADGGMLPLPEAAPELELALANAQVHVFGLDRDLRLRWAANLPPRLSLPAALGKRPEELVEGPEIASVLAMLGRVIERGEGDATEVVVDAPGGPVVMELRARPLRRDGTVVGLVGSAINVSRRALADAARWRTVLEHIPAAVVVYDHRGRIEFINDAGAVGSLVPRDECVGCTVAEAFPAVITDVLAPYVERAFATGERQSFNGRLIDGPEPVDIRSDWIPILGEDGAVSQVLAIGEDITEHNRTAARLQYLGEHDELTGLLNRRALTARVEAALGAGGSAHVAVIGIGLDRFKALNEFLGYDAGDEALREVARRLETVVGDRGAAARLAGDEFAVLRPAATAAEVELEAAAIRESMGGSFQLAAAEAMIGATVGIADAGQPCCAGAELVARAMDAVDASKRLGPGGLGHWSRQLGAHAPSLAAELQRGLERGELVVHYQPIVAMPAARTIAVEALVRWNHPERGLLLPGEFLPAAEAAGHLPELDLSVLGAALRQRQAWARSNGAATPAVCVNVSLQSLRRPEFPERVAEALDRAGADGAGLILELTEDSLVVQPHVVTRLMEELGPRGVRLAIDDFGTGYSSLSRLAALPISMLKVDRSFLTGIPGSPEAESLLRSIIGLGRGLGLGPVVEGVETAEQLAFAIGAGALSVQGFLLGRPAPAGEHPPAALALATGPAVSSRG
jgi:diguanylate cyclase (GGDEF)-like protein/PAS domain S-box-containing protein